MKYCIVLNHYSRFFFYKKESDWTWDRFSKTWFSSKKEAEFHLCDIENFLNNFVAFWSMDDVKIYTSNELDIEEIIK